MWYRHHYARHEKAIEEDIFRHNCYGLPEHFRPDDVIIDVGAHIGIFALTCMSRGAKRIIAFEAHPSNFKALQENVARHCQHKSPFVPEIEPYRFAVWRSDRPDGDWLDLAGFDEQDPESNTGGSSVAYGLPLDANARRVPSVGLDTVLRTLPRCRFLKLDCEGAEYAILGTSRLLGKVDQIAVEQHDKPLHPDAAVVPPEELPSLLAKWGFKVTRGQGNYSQMTYATRL